jgi:hypothetical protein
MESNYRNREFEQYVKENADQYRMFPSENVWKGINNTLHTRRKWYGIGLAFLLLMTGSAVTWVMMSYPVAKNQPVTSVKAIPVKTPAESTTIEKKTTEPVEKVSPFNNKLASVKAPSASVTGSRVFLPAFDTYEITGSTISETPAEQSALSRIEKIQIPASQRNAPFVQANSNPFNQSFDIIVEEAAAEEVIRNEQIQTFASDRPDVRNYYFYPMNIDDVTNAYIPEKLGKKISWQFFVTPTVSYRKLDENKRYTSGINGGVPFASLNDVNKAVTHKPDMGLQIGLSARYPVTRNLKIRGGLQFNLNRYDIKAFAYNPEIATITLNNTNGGNSSVSTITPYRTYSGYKTDWLKNFYFSVSAPIGAELKLFGNKKTSFGVAGTIQPTYIIKDRAYLISSDYKNYAKVPWLIRHVNLNTGFEVFVNNTSGKTKWQVGPQVRYQVLSSFHNKYPVTENLFDFGMKVGITLNE